MIPFSFKFLIMVSFWEMELALPETNMQIISLLWTPTSSKLHQIMFFFHLRHFIWSQIKGSSLVKYRNIFAWNFGHLSDFVDKTLDIGSAVKVDFD